VRSRVEKTGGAGLEVRTVYNWFTGYDPKDGNDSPGLTRRMVDIYLLSLAQQGHIRISDRKGAWIDRSTIGEIEFKPEHLRNLHRIELPRALPDWQLFYPYLESLLKAADGSLGPKFDKRVADDALKLLWDTYWIREGDIDNLEDALRDLFSTLGREKENPFDDLLLYWMQFAEEKRPEVFDSEEIFDALRRAATSVSGVSDTASLTSEHLTTFKENLQRLTQLKDSFEATRLILIRAARLARALLPATSAMREVEHMQSEVLDELANVADLVVNPDTVNTRLLPRLQRLEDAYIPTYLDELMTLATLTRELLEATARAEGSADLRVVTEFGNFTEAGALVARLRRQISNAPKAIRRDPEDRDLAEREVRTAGSVRDLDNQALTFRRLAGECEGRRNAIQELNRAPRAALCDFTAFLRSQPVVNRLLAVQDRPKALSEMLEAGGHEELADMLVTMPNPDLKSLAKIILAAIGDKSPKTVALNDFKPKNEFLWEEGDVDSVTNQFRDFLREHWEEGHYLKLERTSQKN
jgi:hypothetical protein